MDKGEIVFRLNEKYQKAMTTIIQLSTGALIVPIIFMRNMLPVSEKTPIRDFVDAWLLLSWFAFGMSIILGCLYLSVSPKYVQSKTESSEPKYERISDWSYRLAVITFLCGIIIFAIFAYKAFTKV